MNTNPNLAEIERSLAAYMCREPLAVQVLRIDWRYIVDASCQRIIQSAIELAAEGHPPTTPLIALRSGVSLEEIELLASEVTAETRRNAPEYARLLKEANEQRNLVAYLDKQTRALTQAHPYDARRISDEISRELLLRATSLRSDFPIYADGIIAEMRADTKLVRILPTGIPIIDAVTRGGPRTSTIHVIGAAPKNGKTTIAKAIGLNYLHTYLPDENRMVRICHAALDGGNRTQQMCDYWAMKTKLLAVQRSVPTDIQYPDGNRIDCLTGENLYEYDTLVRKGGSPQSCVIPIPNSVVPLIEEARQFLIDAGARKDFLLLDMETLGSDLDDVMTRLTELYLRDPFDVLLFDHATKVGENEQGKQWEKLTQFAGRISYFTTRNPVLTFLLSQRSSAGFGQHDKSSTKATIDEGYNPHLEGGQALIKIADALWIPVLKQGSSAIKLYLHLIRRGKSTNVPGTLHFVGDSGLLDCCIYDEE